MEDEEEIEEEKDDETIRKAEFIRLVAKKADFRISDIEIVWKAIEEVFQECVINGKTLSIRGFGKLHVRSFKARRGYNAYTRQHEEYPEAKKVLFTLADLIRDIPRPPKSKKIVRKMLTRE